MDSYEEKELKKFFWKYEQALKYLDLVMESYVSSLEISDEHNPVEHYKGRIKNIDSIRKKLAKKGFEFTIKNMEEQLHDIAGIRIVCHFRNDLNELIEIFKNNPNISVVEEEDYITNPKKSGYLSYHMTVKVPVVDEAKIVMVPAEIQIRTLLMDLPASLEHKTRYKKEWSLPKEMDKNITEISELSSQVDEELERRINSLINVGTRTKSPNSIIYDMNFNNVINDEMMIKYSMALEKLRYMIEREIFGNSNKDGEDIIDNIKFRLKTKKSTVKKLLSKGFEVNEENIAKELSDVVGARIVCSFISDMPSIIDKICNYPMLEVAGFKDYVNNPKPNGYSSYHLLVLVPIYYNGNYEYVKAEIQIRTKAMNVWSSLHHKICYKKETTPEVEEELRALAGLTNEIDQKYDEIYRNVKDNLGDDVKNKAVKKLVKTINEKTLC